VLVARGTSVPRLAEEAPLGSSVTIRLVLDPVWTGITDAIGGGPILVRRGTAVFRANELFTPLQLARNPRTAVAQLGDGRIVMVVADGRRAGYSVGMTNFELAMALVRLGAVTASGLDAGGSSTMAFDGALLNRPSDPGGERSIAGGLFVLYNGVVALPPEQEVVSPNGDAFAESQSLAYKLVRPSRVTVSLVGPDRVARPLDAADKAPGTYRLQWNALTAEGAPEPEGNWRFSVTAVDDQGQQTTADRVFSVNRTLASLRVPATVTVRPKRGGSLRASFRLARPATVTVTVRTPAGALVRTVARRALGAGDQSIVWNGKDGRGRVAYRGRYLLSVHAANAVGRTELASPFSVRR
jgi:hypothetical protein